MARGVRTISPESLLISTTYAAELLAVSKPSIYKLVEEGRLREVRIGDRRLIVRESLDSLVAGAEAV